MRKTFFMSCIFYITITGQLCAQQNKETDSKGIRPALLVIDIQNEFLPMATEREKEIAFWMINGYIDAFRAKGFPVIRIYHTDPFSGPQPGTPAFEYPDSIHILSSDAKVVKNFGNAFKKTDLDKILQEKGCNTLFLCGLSSVGCVISTYFGARDNDYKAFLIKDALLSHNPEYTDDIEKIFNALDYDAIEVMLDNAVK
jgi:nicotinamidase-related amidase